MSNYPSKPLPTPPSDELDYEACGVEPPSHDEHGDLSEHFASIRGQIKHDWRQQGAVLFCVGCPWEHATEPRFLNYILTGTDADGKPILQKINEAV